MIINNKFLKYNKGYTLLFSVIVASIVLSVGISILNISKKEFLLASSARESITAFYSADSGLECALFNDYNLATTTTAGLNINCINQSIPVAVSFPNSSPGDNGDLTRFDFTLRMSATSKACANIIVWKSYIIDTETFQSIPTMTIESRGYNIGWDDYALTCSLVSPRKVERAIRYTI